MKPMLCLGALLLAAALVASGCTRHTGPAPEPTPEEKDPQHHPVAGLRIVLFCDEWGESHYTREIFESVLTDFDLRIAPAGQPVPFNSPKEKILAAAAEEEADLIVMTSAAAVQKDKFGNFYLFEGTVRFKVLNAATAEIIETKTFGGTGKRELDDGAAAASAISLVAEAAAAYLAEKLSDKAPYVLTVTLVVDRVNSNLIAENLRREIKDHPGIVRVRKKSYELGARRAVYEVDYAAYAKGYVDGYLQESELIVTEVSPRKIAARVRYARRVRGD